MLIDYLLSRASRTAGLEVDAQFRAEIRRRRIASLVADCSYG